MRPLRRFATRFCGLLTPRIIAVREVDFSLHNLRMEQTAKLPVASSAKDVNSAAVGPEQRLPQQKKTAPECTSSAVGSVHAFSPSLVQSQGEKALGDRPGA
jgi:hypothetical protein